MGPSIRKGLFLRAVLASVLLFSAASTIARHQPLPGVAAVDPTPLPTAPDLPTPALGESRTGTEAVSPPYYKGPAAPSLVTEEAAAGVAEVEPAETEFIAPSTIIDNKPRDVVVGIVRDGPSVPIDELARAIQKELTALVHGEFNVTFVSPPEFDAGWELTRIGSVLQNALDDGGVDIVLSMGLLLTGVAAQEDRVLDKPVVGGLILDADISGLPCDERGYSTKRNLTFVVSSLRVFDDLDAFRKMIDFKRLHILADAKLIEGTEGFGGSFSRLGKKVGFQPVLVPMNTSAEEVLERLENGVEAVYLTPPLRMARSEKQALVDGINQKGIPSFSIRGLPDVEKGVLAGISPRTTRLLARRIALNLQRIMRGEPPRSLSVYLTLQKSLVVNAKTAAEIGYSPDFETVLEAEFIQREALEKGESLTLRQAMDIASEQNIDLAVREAEVRASKQDRNKAFSFLLPQVEGDSRYERIDKDRAVGSLPEWRSLLGFQVNQILFDDEVFSNWRVSKRAYRQMRYEEESLRLDIVELAARRFFDYLSAKLLLKIEMENLRLTKSNVELARVRYRVGSAGREEVYRWEAQLARNKSSVLSAESAMEQARVALNQTLGVDQDTEWKARDIIIADDDYYFLDNRLKGVVENEANLGAFRQFAVEDAFENSPGLMAVGQAIDAQRIALNQLKRKFGLPRFSGVFVFDHAMHRHMRGSGVPGDIPSELPDRDDWFLGASASIPLFQGGGRFSDVYRAEADLDKLTGTRERLRQLIEKRTLNSIYAIESSQPNIRLSRQAADRAHKNLEIVIKKYTKGIVSILDLLDAQNQALVEDRAAAIAAYDYLKNLYEFQRSISWFQDFKTPEEKDEWVAVLNAFLNKSAGGKGRTAP